MSQPASQVKFAVLGLLCECLTISDYEGSNWKWISEACALNSCLRQPGTHWREAMGSEYNGAWMTDVGG